VPSCERLPDLTLPARAIMQSAIALVLDVTPGEHTGRVWGRGLDNGRRHRPASAS
jgi:hypothetical protein